MSIPQFVDVYGSLIETSSISSSDPKWDQGNEEVIQLLAQYLSDLNFNIQIENVAKGKQNLVATLGEGDGGLLLSGHTDTVPFDESGWNYNPLALTQKEDRFYGLGVADMKGFFAFIIETLKNMQPDKRCLKRPLHILATCDEETSMVGARYFQKSHDFKPNVCVIGEPTGLVPVRAHKGHMSIGISIQGKSGHSSDPANGINAIEILYQVIGSLQNLKDQLKEQYQHPAFEIPYPTLNLGKVSGGDSPNRICGQCELHFDIRPLPGLDLTFLQSLLKDALKPVMQEWNGRLDIKMLHIPIPGYECSRQHPFVGELESLTGQTSQTVNYCTEAAYLQDVCPTLVVGPGYIDQAHQANEYLEYKFIEPTKKLLEDLIGRYCL